jgi:uncharacterized sporulation protein YeaH/YhbH (DUF444 family)
MITRDQISDLEEKMEQLKNDVDEITDRISRLETMERDERYKHVHDFTPHKLPAYFYISDDCED